MAETRKRKVKNKPSQNRKVVEEQAYKAASEQEQEEPAKQQPASSDNHHAIDASSDDTNRSVELEVTAAFEIWNNAWNRGDLNGYLDAYWDSAETRYVSETLKNVDGVDNCVVLGRSTINRVFTDVFERTKSFLAKQPSKKGKVGYLSLKQLEITPAGSVDAIVFGEFQLEMTDAITRGGLFTIHVRKVERKWVIISEHATSLPTSEVPVPLMKKKTTFTILSRKVSSVCSASAVSRNC
jgi:hypothetical protein